MNNNLIKVLFILSILFVIGGIVWINLPFNNVSEEAGLEEKGSDDEEWSISKDTGEVFPK